MTAPGWRATALGVVGAGLLISWLVIAPQLAEPQDLSQWAAILGMVPCLAVSVLLTLRLPGAAISRVITIFTLCTLSSMVIDAAARLNSGVNGLAPSADHRCGRRSVVGVVGGNAATDRGLARCLSRRSSTYRGGGGEPLSAR